MRTARFGDLATATAGASDMREARSTGHLGVAGGLASLIGDSPMRRQEIQYTQGWRGQNLERTADGQNVTEHLWAK
jgi:hypothetical protein